MTVFGFSVGFITGASLALLVGLAWVSVPIGSSLKVTGRGGEVRDD